MHPQREPTLRGFFAAPVPSEVAGDIAKLVQALRQRPGGDGVRWVRPESYHLTLRFLGSIAEASVPELLEAVRSELAGAAPCSVEFGAPHAFPSARQPRVVVLAAEPEAPLAALAERIERAVVKLGFARESRRFRAHLTLGRVRSRRLPELGPPAASAGRLAVGEVVLFRSDPAPDGARYTALASLPLAVAGSNALPASTLSPVFN